jgi:hypothetical protein
MSSQTCAKCTKPVYPLEMVSALNKAYHKQCFRCTQCDTVISLKSFAAIEGDPYCKPHYLNIFKSKGNYNSFKEGDNGSGSSSFNTSGFKGMDQLLTKVKEPQALKHSETVDKSGPQIEKDVKIKKVDRGGFLTEVEKGAELKHADQVKDGSAPKIPASVKLGDHDGLMKEVSGDHTLKTAEDVHDRSAPVLEKVEVKKVDRKAIIKEGIVDHPPALREANDLSNDRSAPVIAPDATVTKGKSRSSYLSAIRDSSAPSLLKKPDAVSDHSAPNIPITRESSKSKSAFIPRCAKCTKPVYPLESLTACDKTYHKQCFRCKKCDGVLGLKGFAAIEGDPYCKPHYLEIFKTKGTYSAFNSDPSKSSSFNANNSFKGYNS